MSWPGAVPFDPSNATASPAIAALLQGSARSPVLLLAVGPAAQRDGWAARAAVSLAEAFAILGEDVVLADLSLHKPELHSLLRIDNDEGLSDVFLFGASFKHITRSVPDKSFRVICASPFTPDPAEIMTHARWANVFEDMAAAHSKLILFLPVDVSNASALCDRVGQTIVLAERTEFDVVRATLSVDADVLAVLHAVDSPAPPKPRSVRAKKTEPSAPPVDDDALPTFPRLDDKEFDRIRIPKDGAREALIADLRKRQRAALMAPPPLPAVPQEGARVIPVRNPTGGVKPLPRKPSVRPVAPGTPPPPPLFTLHPAQPTPRRARGWFTWVLFILVISGLAGGAWYVWQSRFRAIEPLVRPSAPAPTPAPSPATTVSPPTQGGTPLPYSVAIAIYPQLRTALDRLHQVELEASNLGFYVSPVMVQDTVSYRVLAGPVADSSAAKALRDTLIARGIKTGTSGWDVLATPYAFFLGEYVRRSDAEIARRQAETQGVPSYIIALSSPGGPTTFKHYAGAFMGPGEAEFMRPTLKSAGLSDNLLQRTGSIQ